MFDSPTFSENPNCNIKTLLKMGTWKAGQSIIYTGIRHPTSIMKNVIPIVMAGGMCWVTKDRVSILFSSVTTLTLVFFVISSLLSSSVMLFIKIIVIGIYGLIVGVIIGQSVTRPSNDRENSYSTYTGMAHLCAGLCTGLSGLAAGLCIGIVGDYGVRAVGYRASAVTLFPTGSEAEGYSNIPDSDEAADHAQDEVSGSDDQNKLFVGMLIMLIFSEALAL